MDGPLGQVPLSVLQVAAQMRQIAAAQRAAGQPSVPLAWVDSWAAELEVSEAPAYYQPPIYPQYPPTYYSAFFHPLSAFIPLRFHRFGRAARGRGRFR